MNETVTGIFRLDAGLFAAGDNAAYLIWEKFMVFANIGMIIILLLVIFSQLTGYGIDNYGIKKILPKLIIAAVLINLSFLLCQIAIDLSNIIGRGLFGLSNGIYNDVWDELKVAGKIGAGDWIERGFGAIFTAIFTAGAGAGAAAGVIVSMVLAGPLWFIPLIIVVLIGLVAFLIFFFLLATRQLLAVILVAVAPLAILCYALPNTQKIFKKWVDLFKAILIVYPVCAGLYGISKLMKLIAYSADGVHIVMVMVAMLMTFLPLYAAPILIKKSLAGFNMIGGMLMGMGEKVKGGLRQADQAFKSSEVYKEAQRQGMMNRAGKNIKAFEAVRNGKASKVQRFRSWISGGERGYARNQALLERNYNEDVDTTRMAMRNETGNYNEKIMGRQLNELLDKADNGTMGDSDKRKIEALSAQLSSQAGGARELARAAAGRTGKSAQIMGEYMARNSQVTNALSGKSRRTSSRLSDVAAGVISASTTQADYDKMNNAYLQYRRDEAAAGRTAMNEANWRASEAAAGRVVDETTVVQDIARNVLDKDKEFVSQSGSEVQELLKHVDQSRIDKMASNPNLFSYGDVADGVEQAVLSRASSTYVDGSGNEVKVRNIQKDNTGTVTSYDIDDGSGWVTQNGNLDSYMSKSDYNKQQINKPTVRGTRALTHDTTGKKIRVQDMSDGKVIDIDSGAEIDLREYH